MNILEFYRRSNNLTLDELSQEVGISRLSLGRYENGHDITNKNKEILAEYFKISEDGLSSEDFLEDSLILLEKDNN